MALETLWALLNRGVSEVSGVQPAPVLDFPETPTGFHGVSGVSGRVSAGNGDGDGGWGETPETPAKNTGFQEKMARALACTPETPETPKKSNAGVHAETPAPRWEPWPFDRREPTPGDALWMAHKVACPVCLMAWKQPDRCPDGQHLFASLAPQNLTEK